MMFTAFKGGAPHRLAGVLGCLLVACIILPAWAESPPNLRGRIITSEATYQHLLRTDPALAATCIEKEPVTPKGFNRPVRIYEVPWLPPGAVAEDFQTMMFVKPKS